MTRQVVKYIELSSLTENVAGDDATEQSQPLGSRQVRSIYLITCSWANEEIVPNRESFVQLVLDSLDNADPLTRCEIVQWVCSSERHRNDVIHYHMAVKLNARRWWSKIRNYLDERLVVKVNFSTHHSNYYSAWQFTTKEHESYLQSDNHPDLTNTLDFQKSPSSDFIWRGTNDFSYLIGTSFTDLNTGRCAWTNQSSSQGPLGTKLSLTSTKRIETWLAVQIPTWGRLRKRWKMLLRPRAILNCVTIKGKQSKHICRRGIFCVCSNRSWQESDFWAGSIHFRWFIWRGLQCHPVGDCSADFSHDRSGLKPKFQWH